MDWENDATTSFRRTLDDPHWASDDPSWSGDLTSLLEPGAFPDLKQLEPAEIGGASQRTAANTDRRSRARQSLVSSAPLALEEPRLGIEGSLARSMRPRQPVWQRSLWFLVPMVVVLGAGLYWNPRGELPTAENTPWWPLTPPPRALTRGLPVEPTLEQVEPEPVPVPVPVPDVATGGALPAPTAPAPDDHELAALAAFEEPAETITEPIRPEVRKTPARATKSSRAAARKRQREAKRARSAAYARPMMPMPDATPDEPASVRGPANQGTLQINSRPWARVIVDGRFVGHTPQRGLRLAPGKHRIRLENAPLDMSKTFDVSIVSGRTLTRVELLEENANTQRTSQRD